MPITRDAFISQFKDNYRRILGRAANDAVANLNYQYLLKILEVAPTKDGVIEFSNAPNRDGTLKWTFKPATRASRSAARSPDPAIREAAKAYREKVKPVKTEG